MRGNQCFVDMVMANAAALASHIKALACNADACSAQIATIPETGPERGRLVRRLVAQVGVLQASMADLQGRIASLRASIDGKIRSLRSAGDPGSAAAVARAPAYVEELAALLQALVDSQAASLRALQSSGDNRADNHRTPDEDGDDGRSSSSSDDDSDGDDVDAEAAALGAEGGNNGRRMRSQPQPPSPQPPSPQPPADALATPLLPARRDAPPLPHTPRRAAKKLQPLSRGGGGSARRRLFSSSPRAGSSQPRNNGTRQRWEPTGQRKRGATAPRKRQQRAQRASYFLRALS
jgi:hypothetical protein